MISLSLTGCCRDQGVSRRRDTVHGGPRDRGTGAVPGNSTTVVTLSEQPPLLRASSMIGRDDGIPVPDDPLANEPPNPIDLPFLFAAERLRIPAQDNSSPLDLGSDGLGEIQVVAPDAPLRHPPDSM